MTDRADTTKSRTARRPDPRTRSVRSAREVPNEPGARPRVHAVEAGRLVGNRNMMHAASMWAMLRRWVDFEFPAYVYVIERPGGHIVIDTGVSVRGWRQPFLMRRFWPVPHIEGKEEEVGPRMRAAGLEPEDVRTVVLTHPDPDHVAGLPWFPNAEVLVHRPDYEFASTFMGRMRYQPDLWPEGFEPTLYDLEPEPCGPFPESRVLGGDPGIRLVPLPGHSPGQIGVILRTNGVALFFCADHVLRQDWLVEDLAAGRLTGLGWLGLLEQAAETTRRIRRFTAEVPTVLLPAHDSDAPRRLAELETIAL
jgi:N-acyl homoserine lactone hydrolase